MSSYIKLIIFIVVLVLISSAVLFMESSTDDMNKSMVTISDGIVNGDNDYNEAVDLVNDKNYDNSMQKAISAENNFNSSLNKLKSLQGNFTSDIDSVHREYINTAITEVELKLQAASLLKQSIECFEVNSNYTGTNYGLQANDLMDDAVIYQNQRGAIVQDNKDLFKEKFSI